MEEQAPPPNQIGMSLGPFSYPSAQEKHTANATGQEPMVYNTLDLDSYNLGKSELNSSFLDLLSGRLQHPPNETRPPYSAFALAQAAQLQVRHGGSSVSCDNPATSIPPSSKNHGSDAIRNEQFSPFLTSKASPLSSSTKDPYLLNNFQVEASNCHSSAFGKPVSFQASQGGIGVAEKSSRTLRWPSASSPSNAKQQHMLNQITRKMPLESRPSQGCSAGIGMSSKTLQLSSSSSPSIANHQHRLNQHTQKLPLESRPSIQGSSARTEISSRTLRWPSESGPSIQGSSSGTETSSRTLMWPSASSPSNAIRQHVLNQGTEKMTSEVRPPISNHSSAIFRGRPRVFCMNKAGELFVSDMGHFGVICFCHGQPMSVKMFSEHSGSPSANPGEAVHLENGMTIAQWRTLFSGVMASDRGNGWDWSNSPSPIGGLLGSKPSNLPTSSQNSASINSLGTSGGSGNSGEQRNKFVFPDHAHTELGELTVLEKSVRRGGDHGHQSGLHGHTPFTKNFSVSPQSTLPALAKNHMVQDIQKSPTLVGFDGPCLYLNQGQHDAWPQLVANNITSMREKGNLPISFSSSGMKNSFNYGNNIRRGDFPSKTLLVDQDGPSNIELRLGHSSQKNNTFTSSSPAAMRTLHIGAVNLQKAELCQSLTCRTAEHPRETKKSWFNLQRTPSETSSLHRQSQHSFGSNMLNHSESELTQKNHSDLEVPTDGATKNSLISFLSHLGTGGNCSSTSTDTICNRGEHLLTKELDNDFLYTKLNISGFVRDPTNGIERKSNTGIGGCVHSSSLDDRQATLYFNKLSGMMQTAPNCTNTNRFPEVTFLGNMDHHGNATHEPASPFRIPTSRHASLSSEIPNLRDGSLKFTSLRHLESSLSSHENPLLHRRSCCLSDVEQQRNVVSRDDLVAAKERNEELYHITEQAAEDMAISAHSQQRNVVSRDDLVAAKERNKGLYRITQHDAEDTAVKSAHSLSSCYSGGEVQILAVKPDSTGLYNCFDCSASTQRLELCPKEHGIHLSSGHICHAEQPFQRLGTISNHCYSGRSESETCGHKEESSSFSGKCCYTASRKYLTGCCYPLVDSFAGALNGHLCRNAKPVHINPPCDEVLKDCERVRLGHCECLQEHRVVKNDCRVALWRDVPKKVVQHSDATSNENSLQILQAEKGIGKQRTHTAGKVLNGVHQESRSTKEQQMSIVSCGTSAPAVTEVSIEANNVVSFSTDAETSKFVHDLVVDEGSRIEKCGSSSGEAHDNRECGEASAFKGKVKNINSSCNLTGELRLNSSNLKRKHQIITGCTAQTNVSQIPDIQSACKARKGKGSMQWSSIEASVPGLDLSSVYSESPKHVGHSFCQSSVKVVDHPCEPEVVIQKTVGFRKDSSFKRKCSAFSSTKPFSKKRLESYHEPLEFSEVQSIEDDHTLKKQKVSTAKKAKQDLDLNGKKQYMKDGHQLDAGKPPKFMSLSCFGNSSNHGIGTPCKKARPVVCGNSGIISSGLSDKQKPAKLVLLDSILKKTSRCSLTEYEGKLCMSRNKKTRLNAKTRGPNTFTKLQGENEDYCDATSNIIDPSNNASCKRKKYSSKDDGSPFGNYIIRHDGDCGTNKALKSGLHHEDVISGSMLSCEEIHKCSLNKLTGSNRHAPKSSCSVRCEENEFSGVFEARNQSKSPPSTGKDAGSERHTAKKCLISRSSGDARSVTSHDDKDSADEPCELKKRRPNKEWNCQSIVSDSKASCCVCGDPEKEDVNQLLECNNCLIRVHQACYGIAKAPKGRWCCRPCKTNSLNTVCVLCGYGNGAMTRALKSQNAVNSLLRTWKLGTTSSHLNSVILSERRNAQFLEPDSVGKASEFGGSVRVTESVNSEVFPGVTLEKDLARVNTVQHSESVSKDFQAYNSIIAGTLDPSVAQWVHMVCGLWIPGTRCPNVDTMSTFDVSGASPARKNCVCSLCNRPGGSCIACRVPNCSVLFHPWCAHQKGLLQSETEGDDNKTVGFYGRCMDHATYIGLLDHSHHADNGVGGLEDEISTCARTGGFKGRKKDEGFDPNHQKPCKDGGPCIVSEEQKNAWLHINRKKPCTRRVVKAPSSDLEYDVRKEYIRYKQSKGWKHLVVYKSGIHALGLYTSQFIGRGAMVVEYVGEIVGLRVADKREIEYQSGRRLQYKSACYFFRIDKEYIIDATRKGGIARFVNHSCRPNCAAKVISVRNEKKVVFFAERDIYQGEEITYDYHFNHEDEGQKIPCLCNSTNCRHYLN